MRKNFFIFSAVFLFVLMLCFALVFAYLSIKYPLKFEKEISLAANEFGIEKKLIASIINAESSFNENAVSKKGAVGLMQVLPSTASWVSLTNFNFEKEVGESELFSPLTNIRVGTCYIKYLLEKFGNLNVALCAYNAGEGTVLKWLENKEISSNGKTLLTMMCWYYPRYGPRAIAWVIWIRRPKRRLRRFWKSCKSWQGSMSVLL